MTSEIVAYRICKTKYATTAFDGEGAFRFGGRWNSPGTRIVYAAGSLSLATLEMLVHLEDDTLLSSYSYFVVKIPLNLILRVEDLSPLPKNWNTSPVPLAVQQIGDKWAAKLDSPVLEVPTSIVPLERNYLLNPLHPSFKEIKVEEPKNFTIDKRLLKGQL